MTAGEEHLRMDSSGNGALASMIAAGQIAGTSRFRLFPVTVSAAGHGYHVVRRDTGRMLQTSEVGVEAIRLLRKGLTLDAVRGVVGRAHGCDPAEVDLMPLIESLVAADFVAAIDGRRLSGKRPSFRRALRGVVLTTVLAPLMSAVIRHAPQSVMLRFLLRRRRRRDLELARQIAGNMHRAPALSSRRSDIGALARRNCDALRRYYVERLLLGVLPPPRLHNWLLRRSSVSGIDRLAGALAGGRGAILCAFHVTSYSMIPFILAARGYAQTVLMEAGDDVTTQIRQRLDDLRLAGYEYPIDVVDVRFGLRALVRALHRGKTVLLLIDATVHERHDHLELPFLGTTLCVAKGIGWLAWRTGAPVLPLSLESQPSGGCHLTLHPPLPTESVGREVDCVSNVLRGLTAVLEREVQANPAQWLKWKDFRPEGSIHEARENSIDAADGHRARSCGATVG